MDSFKEKIISLKKKIKTAETADKVLRSEVNSALAAVFGPGTVDSCLVDEFHLKEGVLVFKAKNKCQANELFLRKDELKNKLKSNPKIQQLVIR